MSRRRPKEEEHDNHDRWLVSYADFITLLFAFFVVMYALSVINEGKYRLLSDSIISAFHAVPGHPVAVVPSTESRALSMIDPIVPTVNSNPKVDAARSLIKKNMRDMARDVMDVLGPLVKDGQVRVTEGALGITIEINASVLFSPGEALLAPVAAGALSAVARILAPTDFPIIVEGHTDPLPINTQQFPSNWELSGARASSVVRLFIDNGVAAARLTATGYADQRPVADNVSPEGRSRNRRVAITIESRTPDAPADVTVLSTR